jgi:hypothetical protein
MMTILGKELAAAALVVAAQVRAKQIVLSLNQSKSTRFALVHSPSKVNPLWAATTIRARSTNWSTMFFRLNR